MGEDTEYDVQKIVSGRVDELRNEKLSERTPAIIHTTPSKLKQLFFRICSKLRKHREQCDIRARRMEEKEKEEQRDNEFNQWFFK